jgi:flagellar hook-associated protein 3 FlgL
MSDSVSTLGNYLNSTSLIRSAQLQINDLQAEYTTGKKKADLASNATDASKLLNLQRTTAGQQSYISTGTQVNTVLSGYDLSLTDLISTAQKLSDTLVSLPHDDATATFPASFGLLVDGMLTTVGSTLNTKIGDRYIFAGSRLTTAPTIDLRTLPALTIVAPATLPAAFTAVAYSAASVAPNQVPAYDVDNAVTVANGNAPAWSTQSAQLDDQNTLGYGITSNDPSIQQLVYALQSAQAAALSTATEPTRTAYMVDAQNALTNAIAGLRDLSQSNGNAEVQVKDANTRLTANINLMSGQLGDLQTVDSATVAVQLSNVQSQLEGTYKTTQSILNLSLLNYLK